MRVMMGVILPAIVAAACPSYAATIQVNDVGLLVGANGVIVNGKSYDVRFEEGTCASLFSGCDSVSDFQFQNLADATAAAQALVDQVFIDGPRGLFDSNPNLTYGCTTSNPVVCDVVIPYNLGVTIVGADNLVDNDYIRGPENLGSTIQDTGNFSGSVYGVFSATPVPEPATLTLLGLGGVALGMMHRRRAASRRANAASPAAPPRRVSKPVRVTTSEAAGRVVGILLLVALTACGGKSTSSPVSPTPQTPPAPTRAVVTQGAVDLPADYHKNLWFNTPALGNLDISVDWMYNDSVVWVYLGQGHCTEAQVQAGECQWLIQSRVAAPKPRILTFPDLAAGAYTLTIYNGSARPETATYVAGLTR